MRRSHGLLSTGRQITIACHPYPTPSDRLANSAQLGNAGAMGGSSSIGRLIAIAVVALVPPAACHSTGAPRPPASSDAGSAGTPLVPDEGGRIDVSTTGTTGIRGRWFASADTDDCRKRGKHAASECSVLVAPDANAPAFKPTEDLGMCAMGVAAKAIAGADGNPDWGNIWGVRIGLTLNDSAPYDALAHRITGFAFHIDFEPPPGAEFRVAFPTSSSDGAALWGGTVSEKSPVHAGRNEVRWKDIGGPPFVANPHPFDPTRLLSIVFDVASTSSGANSFAFCIRQLVALTD